MISLGIGSYVRKIWKVKVKVLFSEATGFDIKYFLCVLEMLQRSNLVGYHELQFFNESVSFIISVYFEHFKEAWEPTNNDGPITKVRTSRWIVLARENMYKLESSL